MMKIFKELLNFKFYLIIILISVVGSVFCTLSLPDYLSEIIDYGIGQNDINFIYKSGSIMFMLSVLGMIFNIITGFCAAKVSMGVGKNFRNKVFNQVQKFSLEEFDEFSTSSLITRTNNDIIQIQNFMVMFLKIILLAPVMCIGGVIMAFNKNVEMSSVIFLSIPILIVLVILIAKRAIPLSTRMQQKIDRVNLVMREKLTGIRVIRAFVAEDYESLRFRDASSDLMENSLKMQRTTALMEPTLMLVLNATVIMLVYIGGIQTKLGNIMAGDIIAIIQYVMQIMLAITMMSIIFVMYPRASASAERIKEIMETKLSILGKKSSPNTNIRGSLIFKNVEFSFKNAEHPALQGISFEAKPGEITAIIGGTGSGKSVLVKLILRLYDATKGEVLVDGINVKDYNIHDLRAKIGYVPQKSLLFKGTIEENIKMGNESATKERVKKASNIAQALEFISKKEKEFDYLINQGGSNVSGGQRQRLAIARAIVRKPEIYIFDDSFSALDFKTESALRDALSEEISNSTVVIVAQRVSTIMNADRIIVLDEGKAVGIGKHEELIKNCKIYQEIVNSQFSEGEVGA